MSVTEQELIAELVRRLPPPGERVRVGSGDDAAVTENTGRATATTIDTLVEGVHFTLPEFPLDAVGRKALAASLSDLAAMGAEPGEAYVALAAPEGLAPDELLRIAEGMAAVAQRENVAVVGGDVSRSRTLTVCVACVGYEREGATLVTRAGARHGERVVVTGELGGAAAALAALRSGLDTNAVHDESRRLLARQLDPRPRLEAGGALAAAGATAMIDVSDGLGMDLGNIARASGVAIEIDLQRVPVSAEAAAIAGAEGALELALTGGEDFELIACLPEDRVAAAGDSLAGSGYRLTEIGEVRAAEAGAVSTPDGRRIERAGFDHMRGSGARSG